MQEEPDESARRLWLDIGRKAKESGQETVVLRLPTELVQWFAGDLELLERNMKIIKLAGFDEVELDDLRLHVFVVVSTFAKVHAMTALARDFMTGAIRIDEAPDYYRVAIPDGYLEEIPQKYVGT
ncbi:MAG: hypothetical protein ACRD1T_09455 [Acidimicrobiia bacterium]